MYINKEWWNCCNRFRDATAKDMDKNTGGFIEFMKASGCWSYVGFLGPRRYKTETGEIVQTSKQELSLGEGCYHSSKFISCLFPGWNVRIRRIDCSRQMCAKHKSVPFYCIENLTNIFYSTLSVVISPMKTWNFTLFAYYRDIK